MKVCSKLTNDKIVAHDISDKDKMTDFRFDATARKEKARVVRNAGMIPAVIYGKGFDNLNVSLEEIGFKRIYKEAGTSNLIDLNVDKNPIKVLVQETQIDPVSGDVVHVDFYKVDMTKKITTEIPIEFIGTSPLVIEEEGSQIINRDNLEIECLPADLVDHIEVDVSGITDFEKNIKVSEVKVPDTLTVLSDKDEIVVSFQPPRSEEELEALDEEIVEDVDSIEVEADGENEEAEGEDGARQDGEVLASTAKPGGSPEGRKDGEKKESKDGDKAEDDKSEVKNDDKKEDKKEDKKG